MSWDQNYDNYTFFISNYNTNRDGCEVPSCCWPLFLFQSGWCVKGMKGTRSYNQYICYSVFMYEGLSFLLFHLSVQTERLRLDVLHFLGQELMLTELSLIHLTLVWILIRLCVHSFCTCHKTETWYDQYHTSLFFCKLLCHCFKLTVSH